MCICICICMGLHILDIHVYVYVYVCLCVYLCLFLVPDKISLAPTRRFVRRSSVNHNLKFSRPEVTGTRFASFGFPQKSVAFDVQYEALSSPESSSVGRIYCLEPTRVNDW